MIYYRFKTRSSYYFPRINSKGKFIYSLYGNYGSKATKLYWWLFRNLSLFRWFHITNSSNVENFDIIQSLIGDECVFGINMGTPGPEQKKSILGYNVITGEIFFAKFATKEKAKKLSANEIKVYKTLADSGLVPVLYDYSITPDYVFLKCECYKGKHIDHFLTDEQVLKILNVLQNYHFEENVEQIDGLKTCFAHNDFCLWNMLSVNGHVCLVDWEMAGEFPIGHDLFTYIFQTTFFIRNAVPTSVVLKNNLQLIKKYFGDIDYIPYLKHFVDYKINFFSSGQNPYGLKRYMELKAIVEDL